MICKQCGAEFVENHFNQRCCSQECRAILRKEVKARDKGTEKGMQSERRWRKNPEKKAIDKRYQTSERGRRLAVLRQTRLLQKEYYRMRKRLRETAAYKRLKAELILMVGACQKCGAAERLTLDHVEAMILGGEHSETNVQVLCVSCNASKGTATIRYAQPAGAC